MMKGCDGMMLELNKQSLFGTEGSGNQKKIWIGDYLYKIDTRNRESTKEVSAYNLAKAFQIPCVEYRREKVTIDGIEHYSSVCKSYLHRGVDKSITFAQLLDMYNIFQIDKNMSAKQYFTLTCRCIKDYTKLPDEYIYRRLLEILTFDFLICNEDRHLSNLEIVEYANGINIAPIFDNGTSFFRKDSILTYSELERLSRKHKSKPFSTNQWVNLIDISYAKQLASKWSININNVTNVLDGHLKIVKYRLTELQKKGFTNGQEREKGR